MISRVIMHFLHFFGSVFKALLQDQILEMKRKKLIKTHEGLVVCVFFWTNEMRSAKFWASKSRSSKRETEYDLDWDLGSSSTPPSLAPLSRAAPLLVLRRSALCNALCCNLCVVDLIDEHCQAFSVWMPWLSSDFFCYVILFLFFFISSYPGISLEVFQVATVFLLRHLLVRVVSTRTTGAPASTWVNIFLFFSLVCLLVFSFFPLSIFCNEHWFGWHRDRLDFLHSFICFPVIS